MKTKTVEHAAAIDKTEEEISVSEYLNSRNDYKNDKILIPVPYRLLRMVLHENRALRSYVIGYLKNNDIPSLKHSTDFAVDFNHDAPYKAAEARRLKELERAAAEGVKKPLTLEDLRNRH